MAAKEIIEILKEFQKALQEKGIRVAKIILYGSQVSGKFHQDSDLDVAVVSPDFGRDRYEEGIMLFQLAWRIDPRIEPVPVSTEAYDKDTWIPLINEIKEKGVELGSLVID